MLLFVPTYLLGRHGDVKIKKTFPIGTKNLELKRVYFGVVVFGTVDSVVALREDPGSNPAGK